MDPKKNESPRSVASQKRPVEMSRRAFAKRLGEASAITAASAALPQGLRARGVHREQGEPILVVVELAGGNDALNTLVPRSDDAYYKARPRIAVKPSKVLELDEHYGLHPSLQPIEGLYKEGQLALIQGVGYPKPNRSHFHSADIWHTANPSISVVRDGWLGRALDLLPETGKAVPGLAVTGGLPVSMRANRLRVPAFGSLRDLRVNLDGRSSYDARLEGRLMKQNLMDRREGDALELVRASMRASVEEGVRLGSLARAYRPDAQYPRGLGDRLRLISQLITSGHPGRVFYTSMGGYDTHANQEYVQSRLHIAFAGALRAFFQDLTAKGVADRVVLFAWSEFGRRVQENASLGTDHGAAGLALLAGPRVRGGIHGARPSLTDLDRGDLAYKTDFRRVYRTLLDRVLRVPARKVLGAEFDAMDLIRGREV